MERHLGRHVIIDFLSDFDAINCRSCVLTITTQTITQRTAHDDGAYSAARLDAFLRRWRASVLFQRQRRLRAVLQWS